MLTRRQADTLDFIRNYMAANRGIAPSFEEIKQSLGLKSKSGVHRLISALEERGHLRRLPNRARAMQVFGGATNRADNTQDITVRLPHWVVSILIRSAAEAEVLTAEMAAFLLEEAAEKEQVKHRLNSPAVRP